jgi:hypothetical protein
MKKSRTFADLFPNKQAPTALAKLWDFQSRYGFESYSQCFGLRAFEPDELSSWSGCEEDDYLRALIPFAQASGSGSFYALWVREKNGDLDQSPVVIFGDEGGTHVVAKNAQELLRLIAFDAEPSIDLDEVSFRKDPEEDPSEHVDTYKQWLKARLGLLPINDPNESVKSAQAEFKADYDAWTAKYVD